MVYILKILMGSFFSNSKGEIEEVAPGDLETKIKGLPADAKLLRYDVKQREVFQALNIADSCDVCISLTTKTGQKVELSGTILSVSALKEDKQQNGYLDDKPVNYLILPNLKTAKESTSKGMETGKGVRPCQTRIEILNNTWEEELRQFKKINLCPVGNCVDIYETVRQRLRGDMFALGDVDVHVVLAVKTTRVQSDTEMAIHQANLIRDENVPIIVMMFQQVIGTVTIDNVNATFYSSPKAYKTFHVPFRKI